MTPEGPCETDEGTADGDGPPPAVCEYGVCMVDSTTATFSLGQFADDRARSRLRTLLAQQIPAEILMEKVTVEDTICKFDLQFYKKAERRFVVQIVFKRAICCHVFVNSRT